MANKNFEVKHGLSVGGTERITAAGAGSFTDLALSGDLNITGDVNSVSVTDLDVTDKTITLGKGQVESASGGSGIVVDGSSASILWDETNTSWDFNESVEIATGKNIRVNTVNNAGNTANIIYRSSTNTIVGNNASALVIQDGGLVGIGTTSPDGNLHVHSGSAGSVSATNDANELVLEAAANVGMTFLTANDSIARIRFGDADSNARGNIFYNHSSDSLGIQTAASTRLTVDSSGQVGIGTTSPQSKLETNLHSGSDSSSMNANSVNDVHLIRAGFGQNAASTTNAGAKWGLRFVGRNDGTYDTGKSGAIFGVSEDSLGYNRKVGLAFHTSAFDASHAERMRIDADGNVGIGTASPDALLRLDQDANSVAFKVTGGGSGVNIAEFARDIGATASINLNASAGKPQIQFVDSNTFAMGVNSNTFEIADNTTLGTNTRFVITNTGFVGIGGDTSPNSKLTVLGSNVSGGILVEDSSDSAVSPVIQVMGKRSDANKSQSFSGGLALQALYSGGLSPNLKHTGTIYFGTNHTNNTAANIAYAASISGYMTGDANSTTDMPMGINFYTGSTGRALGTSNVTYGDERMRISGNGDVMLGNTVVNPASGFSTQKGFGYDFSHGTVEIAVDSDTTCLVLGRNHGNNGVMQTFRKQSTSFAEMGIEGGDSLYIQAGTTSGSGILMHGTGAKVLPARQGTSIDSTIDLGQASRRWKKLWCQKIDATDANGNTSVGYESHNVLGASGNSGDSNVAIGYQANEKLTTGSWNNAMGFRAGMNVTSGYYNVAIGGTAMYTNQGGHRNTAVGYQALYTANGNDHNTAVGNRAMVSAQGVGSATAVGSQALEDITTGHYCTAVGMRAGLNITDGQSNTCVGVDSLEDTTGGQYNSALGSNAGANITSGSNNLMLGYRAGKSGQPGGAVTSHSNRVCLGDSAISELNCQVSLSVASDQRDKTDFTDLNIGLDFVKGLKPYTFKWDKRSNYVDWDTNPDTDLLTITNDGTHKEDQLDIGFKAQEVEALEVAAGYNVDAKTNLTYALSADKKQYSMKYEKLVPVLVKAIQELEARVKELEG